MSTQTYLLLETEKPQTSVPRGEKTVYVKSQRCTEANEYGKEGRAMVGLREKSTKREGTRRQTERSEHEDV